MFFLCFLYGAIMVVYIEDCLIENYFVTLLPALFYVFITMSFIFSEKIGFNLPLIHAEIIGVLITFAVLMYMIKHIKRQKK